MRNAKKNKRKNRNAVKFRLVKIMHGNKIAGRINISTKKKNKKKLNAALSQTSILMPKKYFVAASGVLKRSVRPNISFYAIVAKRAFAAFLTFMVFISQTLSVSAFEAHIVNVTANICNYSETRTIGYWKNHPEIYKHLLPQVLGEDSIDTVPEADDIFKFSGDASDMRNKLKAQLLGMKLNIYYYHIGEYFVGSEGLTLFEIAAQADLLLADPDVKKSELEKMKDLLDDLNNLHQIKFCPSGIVINEFLPNPAGGDNAVKKGGEWIELYNTGDTEVDLKGWAFYDLHNESKLLITKLNTDAKSTIIEPKGFLTVYRNGDTKFNLNNTFGDAIRLYNSTIDKGNLMDIYAYTVDAPEGKSFALVPDGSTNWVDPIPTPGEPNSIEGEDIEFEPALSEPGEDADVLNTDIEKNIEVFAQSSEIVSPNDPVLFQGNIVFEGDNDNSVLDQVSIIPADLQLENSGNDTIGLGGSSTQLIPPATNNTAVQEQSASTDNSAGSNGLEINDPIEITNGGTILLAENFSHSAILTDMDVNSADPPLPEPTPEAIALEDAVQDENIIADIYPTPSPEQAPSFIEEIIPSSAPPLSSSPVPILIPDLISVSEQTSVPEDPSSIIESVQTSESTSALEQTSPSDSTPAQEPVPAAVLETTIVVLPDSLLEILLESEPALAADSPPDSDLFIVLEPVIEASVSAVEK